MNTAVTIQDISNLRLELERQAKELEGYKAQINPVESTTGSKPVREEREISQSSSSLPDYAKQHELPELTNVHQSVVQTSRIPGPDTEEITPFLVAKENIQPVIDNQQDRSFEKAVKSNKGKEKVDKSSNKRANISRSQIKHTSTEPQANGTETMKRTSSEATNDIAPPSTSSKNKQAGKGRGCTTDAIRDTIGRARALSPELLVYPTPKQTEPLPVAIASTGAKPIKAIKATKAPLQEESTVKSSRKKRKLGSRKTITAEEQKVSQYPLNEPGFVIAVADEPLLNQALIEFKIIPEE